MSFFSYKNGNSELTPGCITGNPCQGLNERICIQVKNVLLSESYSILVVYDIQTNTQSVVPYFQEV